MFRLVRGLLGLAFIAGLIYVAVTVPLGQKTLWQHLKAIADSSESKELVKEVKKKAGELADKTEQKGARKTDKAKTPAKGPSDDGFTVDERRKLRKLIKKKMEGDKGGAEKGGAKKGARPKNAAKPPEKG